MNVKRAAVVAALLLVAGCGGGESESKSAPAPGKSTKAAPQLDSASAIGKRIGCRTPLKRDTASTAQDERYCKVGHDLVSIVRAPDRQTLLSYAQMGQAFGATIAVISDNWAVSSLSKSTVKRLAVRNHWQML
jgi:hypothetical protein